MLSVDDNFIFKSVSPGLQSGIRSIRLYLKVPDNLIRLILHDGFIAIAPRSTKTRSVSTFQSPI